MGFRQTMALLLGACVVPLVMASWPVAATQAQVRCTEGGQSGREERGSCGKRKWLERWLWRTKYALADDRRLWQQLRTLLFSAVPAASVGSPAMLVAPSRMR